MEKPVNKETVMTLGTWNPEQSDSNAYQPSRELLERLASKLNEIPTSVEDLLTDHEINEHAQMMRLDGSQWLPCLDQFSAEQIKALIWFFTLAEEQLAGWESGDKNPVIYCNKTLKKRKQPLNQDELLWIKTNSRNRFLPNGPLL